jgi:hypothetical protein
MKKIILNLLLLCATFFLQAQSRHNITIEGGPSASYLISNYPNSSYQPSINWGGRFGVNYLFGINDRIRIKSGLRVVSLGELTLESISWGSDFTPNGIVPDPTLPHEIQFRQHDYLVEIPFIFHQSFSNDKKWNIYWEVGLLLGRGFASTSSVVYGGKFKNLAVSGSGNYPSPYTRSDFKTIGSITSIGWEKEWKPKRFFFIQPTLSFHKYLILSPLPINRKGLLLTLETGVRWAF